MALGLHSVGHRELLGPMFYRHLVIEFIAIYLLVFSAFCGRTLLTEDQSTHKLQVALTIGFGVLALIDTYSKFMISFTPGIALMLIMRKRLPLIKGVSSMVIQCLACWAAAETTLVIVNDYGSSTGKLQQLKLPDGVQPWQGFVNEIIISIILGIPLLALGDREIRPVFQPAIPAGFAVIFLLMSGKISSPAIHSGIPVGLALATGNWTNHWIFWGGPLVGAIIAPPIYTLLVAMGTKDSCKQNYDPNSAMEIEEKRLSSV